MKLMYEMIRPHGYPFTHLCRPDVFAAHDSNQSYPSFLKACAMTCKGHQLPPQFPQRLLITHTLQYP